MDQNAAPPKQIHTPREAALDRTNSLLNPAAAPFVPATMPPPTGTAAPSSRPHRPQQSSSPTAGDGHAVGNMAPPPNPQLQRLPLVPRLPVLQPAPFVPPSIPPIQPNPSTANNIARLAAYAHPHYTTYPINASFTAPSTATSNLFPVQPQRPPILVPNHPLFVYYGRDLSSPSRPLPRHHDGRPLFFRPGDGNVTDEGFGAGVFVHPVVKAEVAEAEKANMESIVRWDRRRMG